MPDKSNTASWFLRNILYGKFQILAKAKSYSIASFNTAITSMGDSIMNTSKCSCGSCDIVFDSRSKPVYCLQCVRWYHKTNCYRGHRCRRTFSDHPSANIAGFSASQSVLRDDPPNPTVALASATSPVDQVSALNASSPTSMVAASSSLTSTPAIQNREPLLQPAPSILSSMSESQRSPPLPRTVPPPLDPDAHQFHPQALPPPRIVKKQRRSRM